MIIIEKKENVEYDFEVVKILPRYRIYKKTSNRSKTGAEYFAQLIDIGSTMFPIESYVNMKTRIDHQCVICGYIMNSTPAYIMKNNGCPNCNKEIWKNRLRISEEEYKNRLINSNSNAILLSGYIDMATPCLHKCKNCGNEWEESPCSVINRKYCPKCKGYGSNINRKKTSESYSAELLEKGIPVELIGDYMGSNQKTLHRCLLHNRIWETTPSRVLTGNGCDLCRSEKISMFFNLSHEGYLQRLKEMKSDIIPIEKYVTIITPILHLYPCGHTRKVSPESVLQGHGCKYCACKKIAQLSAISQQEFENRLSIISPNIHILGTYISAKEAIKCECMICGYTWNPKSYNLLIGIGCPKCKIPKGERRIVSFLEDNNIVFTIQKSYDNLVGVGGRELSYDFYLPMYNRLIEFHGVQHERPVNFFGGEKQFKIQQEHDRRKTEYAKKHDIDLLVIWYYDYNNIEQILTEYLNLECRETDIPA